MKKNFIILLVLILPYISLSQIKIEERVEIDPQIIQPNYPAPQYTPCGPYPEQTDFYNPYQVIWNRGWLYIDPYQQLFNHQGNDYTYSLSPLYTYNVEITQGGEYCWIQKAGYTDPNTGEFIEPEVVGDQLLGISGEELIGTGQWRVLPGCFIDEKEYPSKYSIYFERDIPAGTEVIVKITGGSSVINYHTIVETPLLTIENGTGLDTLYHYYGRWIDVLAEVNESYYENRPYCWRCGGELPSSVTFTLELIEGQEYGVLYDVETDETALSFSGIVTESGSGSIFSYGYGYRFKFIADGVQPDSTQPGTVTIRCTPSDGDINTVDFSFPVAYNEYPPEQGILVQFAQPQLAPGDTTQILLKKRNPDGTLEDFSQWESFEIGMIEGCAGGLLLSNGMLEPYFAEVYQPVYFVAESTIEDTTITVGVRVGLIEGIIGSSRPVNTSGEETEAAIIESKRKITNEIINKNIKEPDPLPLNPTTFCFNGQISRDYMGDGGGVVGADPINIFWNSVTYLIDFSPKMPNDLDIIVQPKLFSGPYSFDWDLEVKWISTQQSPDKTFLHTFHNQQLGVLPNGTEIVLPETDETIVGGDDLTLTVRYTDDNFPRGIKVTKKLTGMKILGDNGPNNVQMVKDYINAHEFPQPIDLPLSQEVSLQDQRKQMQIIVGMESSYFQFLDEEYLPPPYGSDDIGYPNMNPNPHDWGLSQLSVAEPSLGVIWNWKTNINAGIHFLWGIDPVVHKFAQVKKEFNKIKNYYTKKGIVVRDPNRTEFLLMLSQHYKRGFYYIDYKPGKKKGDGEWVKTSIYEHYWYGDKFWSRFDK